MTEMRVSVSAFLQAWTNIRSEDNPVLNRYSSVMLFHSGSADDDSAASVYAERQIMAGTGQFLVSFRVRERHVTEWTQLTADKPATVVAGPPTDNPKRWDPQLRDVSFIIFIHSFIHYRGSESPGQESQLTPLT